jgi:ectoine hydroxylase-related dioxygenase (phytanoyl-CoA dioxygenase family)
MKPDQLINDNDYSRALDELGFCVAPLFSMEDIRKIRALYHQFSIETKVSGLIASHSKIGAEKNLRLSNLLKEIVMPALQKSFSDFDFFIGGFMVKEANTAGVLPLHQDWNITDESQYTSLQIWIPVDLSYPGNGGMFVLPMSHRFFQNYRSGSYGIPDMPTEDFIRPYLADMIIPPGQALVFHNSLFHASYPNTSDQNRISAIISIYKKNAPLTYTHKNVATQRTDMCVITSEIFLSSLNTFENGRVPDNILRKSEVPINEIDNRKICCDDLVQKYKDRFGEEQIEPMQLRLLRDRQIQKQIDYNGYVILDFFDNEKVKMIKEAYEARFKAKDTTIGRSTTMEHSTPASRRVTHQFLIDSGRAELDAIFENYQTPIASFFIKFANSKGDLSWHNDASLMINTNLEPHYGIWCPLQDVNEHNGAFCLIKGSHKFSHGIYLEEINWPFEKYAAQFEEKKKVLELKAGQMVLFDMRLIHHATPNDSDIDRVVYCVRITHNKSKYYSFSCEDKSLGIVSIFEQGHDIYLGDEWSGSNQVVDKTVKVGEMSNINSNINFSAIEEKLGNVIKNSW